MLWPLASQNCEFTLLLGDAYVGSGSDDDSTNNDYDDEEEDGTKDNDIER